MKSYTIDQSLIFDLETTGLIPKGAKWDVDYNDFPRVVQIAWIYAGKEKSYIIKPQGWTIPEETTAVHGITQESAEKEGVLFKDIASEFIADCLNAKLIIGHNVYFDSSIFKAMVLHVMGSDFFESSDCATALSKEKRIDTMMKTIKFVGAKYPDGRVGKFPKLEELYAKIFDGATYPAHDALEDCRAVKQCLPYLIENDIIQMTQKDYGAVQQKLTPVKKTPVRKRKIEFNDAPVEMPKVPQVPEVKKPKEPRKPNRLLDENDF